MRRRYWIEGSKSEGGYARLTCTPHPHEQKTWWLDFLYVPSEHRGNGLGGELMERALRDADKNGITLLLEAKACSTPNQGGLRQAKLQKWYAGMGFYLVQGGMLGPRMERRPL